MAQNNFILDLIAMLKKSESKKQIKEDLKNLGDFKLPLIGTINKSKTKSQVKQDLASLNGTVNLTGKIDGKGINSSVRQAAQQAQKQMDAKPVEVSFSAKKDKLVKDIKLLAQQNSRLFKDADMTAKYNYLLDSTELSSNTTELSILRTELGAFRSELKITGNSGLTMTDALKNGFSKILQLFGGHGIIMQFAAQLRNAWTEAKELDASIVSLSKVCDELADRRSFPAYIDKSISKAKVLCTDVNDLLYAVTEFKKLGNSLENSEILAEYAIRLQNVGDTDIDTAISSIKTAMASFDEIGGYTDNEYENKVEAYIDLINNLSNKFSIDAESLANAVRISAGTLTEANTSIEEATSIITAANKYYDDPAYLANTLKIGALRLRASKTSNEAKKLAEMGENVDDLAESVSKLRDEMMSLTGVDIMVDEKNFKSYYQQLLDISEVYQTLDETTQANVLEKMFGKNRSAAGANILKAMSDSVEIYNEALQSAGSSEEEFSRWSESAEAATKKFGIAMTEAYSNIISGETVKGLANAGSAVLDFANSWNLLEGTLRGFVVLGVLKGLTTLTVAFKNGTIQISNYGKALNAVKDLSVYAQGTTKYADAMNTLKTSCVNLTDAQLKQVLANRSLEKSQLIEILQLDTLEKEQIEARLSQLGLIQTTETQTVAQGAATASTFSFTAAVKGLGASLKAAFLSNPVGIAIMAISTVIGIATSATTKYNQQLEETRQKNIEAANAAYEKSNNLKDLYNEYNRLASIQARTTSEEESFKTAVENITKALGDKAQMLEGLTVGTDEYAQALSRATKEELQSQAVTAAIGRKSAEEALQEKIWSNWAGSKISVDSNNKGRALSDEARKAVDIVSDSLKEFEAINRTWNNLSWDISSNNPTEALEFYNALIEARERLVLASQDNERLLDTEIYSDMNNAINTMSESLDTYIQQLYEEKKLNYLANNSIPVTTEEYNAMEAAMMDAAGASVDLQDKFKELLVTDFSSLAVNVENAVDAVKDTVNSVSESNSIPLSITQTVDQLNTQIKPAFDSLKSAWQDIFTDEGFKLNSIDILSTCDSIKSKLDEMSEAGLSIDYSAFEDFVQVLNNAEATEQDVKDAFDGLASSITSAGLSGAEDFETLKSALEDLGIINDELVAFEALISNTDVLKEKGLDLADATEEQIRSFANEVVSAENLEQAIAMLTFQKELCALQGMDTSGEVANLLTLAENAGYTGEVIQYLTELEQLYQQVASGTLTPGQLDAKLARAEELQNLIKESASQINYEPKVDFSNVGGGKSGASKVAKEAADTYLKSFEDELKGLKDLKDAGVITEKQYLDRLRALYVKYFKDKKQYAEEYAKYEREYLNGMKSLYESVFAHFISKINDRIKGIEDEKDAAVDALEEEKDAAEAAYQAEIDAIEKANKARERQLDLQQKQYNLEKLMNQKTVLLYSEGKGMHYENDMSGARKARDEVEKAKDEIRIAELEEIIEKSNAYYDELIEQTEKYYDTLIDALEKQKSKFEELQDLLDQAQMQAVLKELGINEEALLSGSEKEFNKLRDSYIGILADLNAGNSDVLSALSELSGMASLPSYLGETVNTVNALADSAGSLNSSLSGIDASAVNSDFDNMAASSSNAAGKVQSVTDALNNLSNDVSNYIIPPVNSDNFVSSFAEDGVILTTLTGFVERFKEICSDIPDIWNSTLSETFGEGGGSGDPLAGGLSNDTKYDALFEPILTALDTCKATMEEKLKECADTWVQFQTDLSEIIGVSGGSSDPEGNNGASAGAGQGTGKQRESSGSDTIVGTIQEGGTLIDESLNGEEGWAASFITAQDSIHGTAASIVECIESMVQEIVNACIAAIEAINMLERAKGGKGNHPTPQPYGRVGHSHAKSGSAFAEGTVGNAFATGTGYRGLPEAAKNALRSEYGQPELTLYPDGTTELTNQPIMSDLPKGTIIFNEEQTKKILNGEPAMKGKVYPTGAIAFENGTIARPNGEILTPLPDDDPFMIAQKKFEAYVQKMGSGIETVLDAAVTSMMNERNKEVDRFINQLNAGNVINNKNIQPVINQNVTLNCPNVTNNSGVEYIQKELGHLSLMAYQEPLKRY